jgi:hypothetical protein
MGRGSRARGNSTRSCGCARRGSVVQRERFARLHQAAVAERKTRRAIAPVPAEQTAAGTGAPRVGGSAQPAGRVGRRQSNVSGFGDTRMSGHDVRLQDGVTLLSARQLGLSDTDRGGDVYLPEAGCVAERAQRSAERASLGGLVTCSCGHSQLRLPACGAAQGGGPTIVGTAPLHPTHHREPGGARRGHARRRALRRGSGHARRRTSTRRCRH